MSAFQKATRSSVRLRMSLQGPAGSGKTYTALGIATLLSEKRVAVVDTEHGSASLYAEKFDFDTVELLQPYSPDRYLEVMRDAYKSDHDVLVIDSLSHAWNGPGGILEMVDDETKRSRSGNSFQAWGSVGTPEQNKLVHAVLAYPGHVLFTMRSKTEWVLEEDSRGKKVPRKIGLAPVQRDGIDYEVSVAVEMDVGHNLVVTKSRYSELADLVVAKPGRDFAERLQAVLREGVPVEPTADGKEATGTGDPPPKTDQSTGSPVLPLPAVGAS